MQCPKCQSSHKKKNGFRRGKQSYKCKDCGYQFVENPISRKYPPEVKQICLKMYLNGLEFRASARVTEIDHTTIINWVKEEGESLPDAPPEEEIPEITEIDELQTFVGRKQNKFWIWTVVNHWNQGILFWAIGDRSHQTFEPIWQIIKCWQSFWYVTDGYPVYPSYIEPEAHLVCKTYLFSINTKLYLCKRTTKKIICSSLLWW